MTTPPSRKPSPSIWVPCYPCIIGQLAPLKLLTAKPLQAEEVNLGRTLFFDRRLSANANLSCGMCHVPEQGFTQNELATPVGDGAGAGDATRPPVQQQRSAGAVLGWPGDRPRSVAAAGPQRDGQSGPQTVINRLADIPAYRTAFHAVYEDGLTEATLGRALRLTNVLRAPIRLLIDGISTTRTIQSPYPDSMARLQWAFRSSPNRAAVLPYPGPRWPVY